MAEGRRSVLRFKERSKVAMRSGNEDLQLHDKVDRSCDLDTPNCVSTIQKPSNSKRRSIILKPRQQGDRTVVLKEDYHSNFEKEQRSTTTDNGSSAKAPERKSCKLVTTSDLDKPFSARKRKRSIQLTPCQSSLETVVSSTQELTTNQNNLEHSLGNHSKSVTQSTHCDTVPVSKAKRLCDTAVLSLTDGEAISDYLCSEFQDDVSTSKLALISPKNGFKKSIVFYQERDRNGEDATSKNFECRTPNVKRNKKYKSLFGSHYCQGEVWKSIVDEK